MDQKPIDIPVRQGTIRLGQFLKLANLVEHGAQAKELIDAGEVQVDGIVETRRGAQLAPGSVVLVPMSGLPPARVSMEQSPED
ncbi:RNA-binding S4 domain-containing protein [Acaricomes phytoseiuli]|uniref:RNA-binding S4 domain-containing protein n=1 Tax=Acaricomes phytoseiuli TaxID=291968 RepID=UPI0003784CFE|nr:RNA-binding S4 domain-containing protein [Acaricomes phytoseiuli]MCW1250272.1 RNA-binding S4 domain-containing protein [Acaricomes phytoseiuli]